MVLGGPGRGIQFRARARETTGDVLLFLHDDVWEDVVFVWRTEGAGSTAYLAATTKIRLRLPAEKSTGLQATLIRSTVKKTCLFGSVTVAGTRPRV